MRLYAVDANGCPTALLADTGPLDLAHCVAGDRWTVVDFPYVYTYGYLPNRLMIGIGLNCSTPWPAQPATWGRVKALYE